LEGRKVGVVVDGGKVVARLRRFAGSRSGRYVVVVVFATCGQVEVVDAVVGSGGGLGLKIK